MPPNPTRAEREWIAQELAKVRPDNVTELYLAHAKSLRLIGGAHREELMRRIRVKFPGKFAKGSR